MNIGSFCWGIVILFAASACGAGLDGRERLSVHIWEKFEITLRAQKAYDNPYTDAMVWVDLKGPGFSKRCYGFWDGNNVFRVRVMATAPGTWTWTSGSQPADAGLDKASGSFTAVAWSDAEKAANPNRRGMIRPSVMPYLLICYHGQLMLVLQSRCITPRH